MVFPAFPQVSILDERTGQNLFRFPTGEIRMVCYNNIVVMETNDGWGEMDYGVHKVV